MKRKILPPPPPLPLGPLPLSLRSPRPWLFLLSAALLLQPGLRLAHAAQPAHAEQPAHVPQTDTRSPHQTVKATIDDVMDAIRKDPAARAGDPGRTLEVVRQRFLPATDFMLTTQYAVGAAWARATPAQRQALFQQFQTLLARTYALQLTQIQGENTQFKYAAPPRLAPGAEDAVVRTTVISAGDAMAIDYRMHRGSAGWKIYDINMMGAWMIQVYRQQFAGQLAAGGIDGLVGYLAAHNRAP